MSGAHAKATGAVSASTQRRYRLALAYDGTAYAGWQVQPEQVTVQGTLERVLMELTGQAHVRAEASGRTDRGVHARGQVVHADLATHMTVEKLLIGLNALLPPDIRVLSIRRVSADFHARYSATGKEYRYFIDNAPVCDPFTRFHRTWIREPLNIAAMREAAALLQGKYDFAAFAANPNRELDGTVRSLQRLSVSRRGSLVTVRACADGFLYKMVRSLVGFLIRAGRGEVEPSLAASILASGVRTARVPTAPPTGLFLWRVYYRRVAAT